MKPPLNTIAGKGFVMWAPDRRRAPVVRALSQLTGPATSSQDFAFRFSQASQLPTYMTRRIDATVAKFMFAVAESYVRGLSAPLLTVGGALVQYGTGNSQGRWLNDQWYLQGTEAAHFGIGTITLQSDAVSIAGLKRVRELARQKGIERKNIHTALEANGQLVAYGLVNDAATFLAPAYFNQTEGVQERTKQEMMRGLLGIPVPHTANELEVLLSRTGERVIDFLVAKRKVAIAPIDERLQLIQRGVNKEYKQDPDDIFNLVFSGEEHRALEAMRSQLADAQSELQSGVAGIERNISLRAQWLAELAEAAKEEVSA
jgi:hypothetical protein